MADFYKILGLERGAQDEEIRKAYKKLSIKFHPDKNNGDEFFENMFKQIQEAYSTLSNPILKNAYDTAALTRTNDRNNFQPIIEYFNSTKKEFLSGEEITFTWKCYNADVIELKPFGIVQVSGKKTLKLNNVNKQFVNVQLAATNSNISVTAYSNLILENSLFRQFKPQNAL